jgi:hypothetical protein
MRVFSEDRAGGEFGEPAFIADIDQPLTARLHQRRNGHEVPSIDLQPEPAGGGIYRHESDDSYPTIAQLDDRMRVITCRDDMQWIVQQKVGTTRGWRGLSYCCRRDTLLRDAKRQLGAPISAEAMSILQALPEWHPDRERP